MSVHPCVIVFLRNLLLWGVRPHTPAPDKDYLKLNPLSRTHKTGSSTVQNILFRYAHQNNLKVALPAKGCRFCYPMHLTSRCVLQDSTGTFSDSKFTGFNILAHHSRFNKENSNVLTEIFQNHNPFKLTILRDPSTLIPSAFKYFNHLKPIQMVNHNATQFLLDPKKYYAEIDAENNKLDLALTRNGMTFDLGYPGIYTFSPPGIKQVIKEIDESFDFVMIMEYFNESLILLKYLLNWSNQDLVYVVMNQKSEQMQKLTPKEEQSVEHQNKMKMLVRDWSTVDSVLYSHFNRTLFRKIKLFGENEMKMEVKNLKNLVARYTHECFSRTTSDPKELDDLGIWRPYPGYTVKGYVLREHKKNNQTCVDLSRNELPFTKFLYDMQYGEDFPRDCFKDGHF